MADLKNLSIDKIIAMLLLSIDQELAAKVIRQFTDDGVDKVTRAMQELQEMAIDRETIRSVYNKTVERMRQGGMALGDVGGLMRNVLSKAFGEQRSGDVARRANSDILAKRPFAMFEQLTAEDLANLLTEEHPQISAVFIAHLDRKKGGEVLKFLEEELRADLVHRVATLDRTPADVVQRVLEVMRKKVKDLGLTTLRSEPKAWVKAAASLLNNLGGGEKAVLEKIEPGRRRHRRCHPRGDVHVRRHPEARQEVDAEDPGRRRQRGSSPSRSRRRSRRSSRRSSATSASVRPTWCARSATTSDRRRSPRCWRRRTRS
jgi:flagellar motor switch protein FliG